MRLCPSRKRAAHGFSWRAISALHARPAYYWLGCRTRGPQSFCQTLLLVSFCVMVGKCWLVETGSQRGTVEQVSPHYPQDGSSLWCWCCCASETLAALNPPTSVPMSSSPNQSFDVFFLTAGHGRLSPTDSPLNIFNSFAREPPPLRSWSSGFREAGISWSQGVGESDVLLKVA